MAIEGAPDIYLVHGWRLGPEALKAALADMTPEALECGLRIVFEGGQNGRAFLGVVLGVLRPKDGEASTAVPMPKDAERLAVAVKSLGLETMLVEKPALWVVAG